MCGICGCGQSEPSGKFKPVTGILSLAPAHHAHTGHVHSHADAHHQQRMVQVEQDILSKNNAYAAQNRTYFQEHGIFALNFVSSPGAGKTTLLVETIKALKDRFSIAVIEGDQQTQHDADRIRATGIPALQINTGRACHLDAHDIGHAALDLKLSDHSLLMIENVGNLVCPSGFDLGEAHKVVVLSVTEGDDKPVKYSDMFHAADLMIITKTDLLPYVDFDVSRCIDYAKQVNPNIEIMQLSATKGDNFAAWLSWLEKHLK